MTAITQAAVLIETGKPLRLLEVEIFTNSGSWGNISLIVRRQTGTRERENGQIVRCNAVWGG